MQRTTRSAHAPVGTALFLFVGLAIIPVSLRVAGVQISFAPRLTAANDAWQQVAEVFGASYHPTAAPDLSVVNRDFNPSNPGESTDEANNSGVFACSRTVEGSRSESNASASAMRPVPVRRSPSRTGHRSSSSNKETIVVAADTFKTSFDKKEFTIGALGALKVATLKRGELLRSIDKQLFRTSFQPLVEVENLPGSKDFRVMVRFKKTVAGSSAKAAERKVFSAMASARRRECDRAVLTGLPSGSPEYGEF
jgi:hypothetical protein